MSAQAEKNFAKMVNKFNVGVKKKGKFLYESSKGFQFEFLPLKKPLSMLYKLQVTYSFTVSGEWEINELITWDFRKKKWSSKGADSHLLTHLNETNLKNIINKVDYERIEIRKIGKEVIVNFIPIPGCYIYLIFPPIQYFIDLKDEEIMHIKKISYLLKDRLLNMMNKEIIIS